MTVAGEPGLRERKKAATRQALYEAALRLAINHGTDRITVEAIADEAGVSRRTFSNYFANKEQALLHGDRQRMRVLLGLVRARPATEPPWTALTTAAEEFFGRLGDLDPEWVARGRLARGHPALAAEQLHIFAALERELGAEVAARSGEQDPSGVRVRLTAAAFLTACRVSLQTWLDQPEAARLPDVVSESLTQAGRGFA